MSAQDNDASQEQRFFTDPATDRVMAYVYALSAEVYVLRDYVQRLEGALISCGALDAGAAESFKRSSEQAAAAAKDRDAFVATLMENMTGRQVSKGG
jgi:hypothetical protein